MLIGKASSLANPLGMSSYGTYGMKPAVGSYVVFSLGAAGDNQTLNKTGAATHITIVDGMATFDVPQDDPNVGIGDAVTHASGTCYLIDKVSSVNWAVSTETGTIPPDVAASTVSQIGKASTSLYSLFDGGTLQGWLGTQDLITADLQVRIACYDATDASAATTVSSAWLTDQSRNIFIYTPADVAHDCNRSQRHDGTFNTSSYEHSSTINIQAPFTRLEGLKISAAAGNGVLITGTGCSVDSCVFDVAVSDAIAITGGSAFSDTVDIRNNIMFNVPLASAGIDFGANTGNATVHSNTVHTATGDGYTVNASATAIAIENCIAQVGTGTGFTQNAATVDYSLSDDASIVGGTGNVASTTLFFRDMAVDDYRLDYRDAAALSAGNDLSASYTTDIEGNERGVAWTIGASQYTATPKFAIGGSADIKTGVTIVGVANSIMTFTAAQTNDLLIEGMEVTYDTTNTAYLYRKIDTSNWYVISVDGTVVGNIGLVALDSITAYADNLHIALEDDGTGVSKLETDLTSIDLTTLDVSIDIILGTLSDIYTSSVACDAFVTDITRKLSIYAARDGRGADSTYHAYKLGVLDETRYMISSPEAYGFSASIDYLEVTGLQIHSGGDGINISGGKAVKITGNIINRCVDGIVFNNHDEGPHEVYNNIVYRCSGNGIETWQNIGSKTHAEFGVAGNDLWSLEAFEPGDEPNHYVVRVVVSTSQSITWGPNSLTIATNGDKLDNILAGAVINGEPWGTITPIAVVDNISTFDAVTMDYSATGYSAGSYGAHDNLYYVYNNTVVRCNNGFLFESLSTPKGNLIVARNNIAKSCTTKCFTSIEAYPAKVLFDANYDDDASIVDFIGNRNETLSVEFRKEEIDDFHIKLCSAFEMYQNVYSPATDGTLQILIDINGASRFGWYGVAGADHYDGDNVMVYSVGSNAGNLDTEPARPILILDDIAKFAGTTVLNESIGVGDKVASSVATCILVEKVTRSIWRVRNVDGTTGVATGIGTVSSITRSFNDFQDAFADMPGVSYLNSGDLTAIHLNLDVACYDDGGTDDGGVIATFTTNDLYRLRVYTPVNTNTECSASQRHEGVWGTGFMVVATAADAFVANADFYTVEGLQIEATNDGIYVRDNCRILNNIVRGAAQSIRVGLDTLVAGNITYGSTVTGIASHIALTPGVAFMNNTVYAAGGVHFQGGGTGTLASNNIAATAFTGFASLEKCFNNIDRSGGLGSSRGNIPSLTLTFEDQPSADYHLNANDVWAIGGGVQDVYTQYYYRDIDNEVIEQWPIGADAINPATRSVSYLVGYIADFKTGTPTISIEDGVATFSVAQTSQYMMAGAMISFTNMDEEVYAASKISTSKWEVLTKYGYAPNDNTAENVIAITTAGSAASGLHSTYLFTPGNSKSLETFLGSDTYPFDDLTQIKLQVNLVYPDFGSLIIVTSYDIRFITDEDHYLKLYTPYDTTLDCNDRSRPLYDSLGIASFLGARLQNDGSDYTVSVYSPYTIIEGLRFTGGNDAIHIQADHVQILGNFFDSAAGDIAVKAREGAFIDSFISGAFDPYWDAPTFATNYVGANNSAARDGWYVSRGAAGSDDLTKRTALIGGRFDLEFGYFFAGTAGADTIVIQASDNITVPNNLFDITWLANQWTWATTDVLSATSVTGPVTYKMRMVRGGTLTQEGVFVPDSNVDTIRCYYYDDWVGAGTYATLKWIELPTLVTGVSQAIFFMLTGDGSNGPSGFSYVSMWAETNGPVGTEIGSGDETIASNIIQEFDVGIKAFGGSSIYNNTLNVILAIPTTGIYNEPTDDVRNNIVKGYATCIVDNTTCSYNTVSDASITAVRENQPSKTIVFVLVGTGVWNYHLRLGVADSDACRGTAETIGLSIPIDAQAVTRARLWDRGALEFIVEKKAFFSTGATTSNLSSLPTGTLFGFADSIVTFLSPQTGDVGKGDRLLFNTIYSFFISEKIDEYNWRVCDLYGVDIPDAYGGLGGVGYLTSITRMFQSLSAALLGSGNISTFIGADLVSAGTQVNIVQYYDNNTPDSAALTISGYTCDVDHFIRIFTPNSDEDSNNSHRHGDTFDEDKSRIAVVTAGLNGAVVYVDGMDFIELEGLQIDGGPEIDTSNGIQTVDCENVFISKCILRNVPGTSIVIGGEVGSHVVVNNLAYDGGEYGIKIDGETTAFFFMANIYNNTVVNMPNSGIQMLSAGFDTGGLAQIFNNLVQDCGICIDQSSDPLEVADLRGNITDDTTGGGSIIYRGYPDVEIEFVDKAGKIFMQGDSDYIAIHHGYDLSDDSHYSFESDISGRDRPDDLWDVGAFEKTIITTLDGNIHLNAMTIQAGLTTYLIPGATYTLILYLRTHPKPADSIPINGEQFIDMNSLNAVAAASSAFDLLIYIEAGETFEGNFVLGNRGLHAVRIATDPDDYLLVQEPGVIHYADNNGATAGPFVSGSVQSTLDVDGIIISPKFPEDALSSLVPTGTVVLDMTVGNSVLVVPGTSIVNTGMSILHIVNSDVFFRKRSGDAALTNLYAANAGIAYIWNSLIAAYSPSAIVFQADEIINCNLYNYQGAGESYVATTLTESIMENPYLKGVALAAELWTVTDVSNPTDIKDLEQASDSGMTNSGNNAYVDGLTIDIINRTRVFGFNVDMGPFEPPVYDMEFTSDQIRSVFQDKLRYDSVTNVFIPLDGDREYRELADQFVTNPDPDSRTEFSRESKIFIELSTLPSGSVFLSDKPRELIGTFEAYIDPDLMTIVFYKSEKLFGNMLINLFSSSQYVFHFDETQHILEVYLSYTHDKGLSGSRNVVKNVRFGGNSVM